MSDTIDVFLRAGECHFGDRRTRIRTLLGSCVAITLWHPQLLVGAMTHCLLPSRPGKRAPERDARYCDEVVEMLLAAIVAHGARPEEFVATLFGGGNMFPGNSRDDRSNIGGRNAGFARELIARHGIRLAGTHVGMTGHRSIIFEIATGDVWVRHVSLAPVT